eukprot:19343-Rhodomonas_salina.1
MPGHGRDRAVQRDIGEGRRERTQRQRHTTHTDTDTQDAQTQTQRRTHSGCNALLKRPSAPELSVTPLLPTPCSKSSSRLAQPDSLLDCEQAQGEGGEVVCGGGGA